MSERSIAEIIGWQFCRTGGVTTQDGVVVHVHGYWCPPDVDYSDGSPPNVDDMLAWLRESPWRISKLTPGTPKRTPSHSKCRPAVAIIDTSGHEWWFPAPTLHAALEAAVRAVAEDNP